MVNSDDGDDNHFRLKFLFILCIHKKINIYFHRGVDGKVRLPLKCISFYSSFFVYFLVGNNLYYILTVFR